MTLIDRYILLRFLANFVTLFILLYVFAVTVDLVLGLEEFVNKVDTLIGEDVSTVVRLWTFVRVTFDFQAPRLFQFYAYLHGLVAIGAMGFTLAQMHRYKELVAILAGGVSMQRVAMPFIVAIFGLSLLQLCNQELILWKVAPMLLRGHGEIGERSVDSFAVKFTPDGAGSLFQSPSFEPATKSLGSLTILERDERGRTVRRVTAAGAHWMEEDGGWRLDEGQFAALRVDGETNRVTELERGTIDFYPTDLSDRVLIVRRYGQFAAMLSLRQITQMLETPGVVDQARLRNSLLRNRYSRFAMVLVNVLVMWLALPSFLLRSPANLVRQTIFCAAIAIPALFVAAIFMTLDLPGITPAVGVFLPVVVLVPLVLARWTFVKT